MIETSTRSRTGQVRRGGPSGQIYAGREGRIDHQYGAEWNAPFDNRGKQYLWSIRQTEKNALFKYYEDE